MAPVRWYQEDYQQCCSKSQVVSICRKRGCQVASGSSTLLGQSGSLAGLAQYASCILLFRVDTDCRSFASRSAMEEKAKANLLLADSNDANFSAHITTLNSFQNGISRLETHLDVLDARNTNRNNEVVLQTAKKHEELNVLLADNRQQPNISPGLTLVLSIPQLNLPTQHIAFLLRHFCAEAGMILRLFFASFLFHIKELLLAVPHLMLLYRVSQRIPQMLSLVMHDNIAFEDALGRLHSLQFQQFKHWAILEMSLRCSFEGLRGSKQVLNGNYLLTSPSHKEQLTAENWSRLVRPGLVVNMGIIVGTQSKSSECPRGCSSSATKMSDNEFHCYACGGFFGVHKRLGFTAQPQASNIVIETHRDFWRRMRIARLSKPTIFDLRHATNLRPGRLDTVIVDPASYKMIESKTELAELEQVQVAIRQKKIADAKSFKHVHLFHDEPALQDRYILED